MKVAIIKNSSGNTFSVDYALWRIGCTAVITDDPELLMAADRVILPGVGEAGTSMRYLRQRGLDKLICALRQPVLGICIGLQLMCRHSEEGDTDCLGIFDKPVLRFQSDTLKVPHMGWNTIRPQEGCPLFAGVPGGAYVYYVHSYYAPAGEHTVALTDYVQPFSAALHRNNFYALQFHPEKSAAVGERILQNFLEL